jgi:biopolymer transport protein ExbD
MARRPAGEINAGSMADISFLILCFFLMVSQMDSDSGLPRVLPQMPDENQQQADVQVNRRNVMVVNINSNDRIGVGGQPIDLNLLKDRVKAFVLNEADDPNLPEKELIQIAGFGAYYVSKGVLSLQNDRATSYEMYMKVQNELVRAYNELRDDFSVQHFGKVFVTLDETQKDIVRTIYKQNISEAEPRDVSKKR